jgi:hypothetical protein
VASLQYRGSVRLRVDEIAPTEADAAKSVEALSTLLGMFRSIQRLQRGDGNDAAMEQTIESLKVERRGDRAELTANVPISLVKQLATPANDAADSAATR